MAPPLEHNDVSTSGESPLRDLFQRCFSARPIVDDHTNDDVISWNDSGSSFIVWNTTVFAKDLLPKYFKHNKFSSLVRQLNTNGFRKVVPDRWKFSNEYFRRGEKRLLCEIQRRKFLSSMSLTGATMAVAVPAPLSLSEIPTVKPILSPSNSTEEQVISSNSSSAIASAELLDENEGQRKENILLTKELQEMRSLCKNIFNFMLNYTNAQLDSGSKAAAKTLHLMPAKRLFDEDAVEELNPKLFWISF